VQAWDFSELVFSDRSDGMRDELKESAFNFPQNYLSMAGLFCGPMSIEF